MTTTRYVFEPTARQYEAYQALIDPEVRAVMYGGAKGGGKSYFLCWKAFIDAVADIVHFKLKPGKNIPVTSWMGRLRAIDFRRTTLETWKRVIPESEYRILDHKSEIVIRGCVRIAFGGLDNQVDIDKFNSAEYCRLYLDQAEEVDKDAVACLRGSLRLKIKGLEPSSGYKELYTANPRNCWLQDEFINQADPTRRFVQALPSDNPHLPDSYIDTLKRAFGHRPELLAAYLEGSWDVFSDPAQLILREWLEAATHRRISIPYPRVLISCDVARFGDDSTCIDVLQETDIVETDRYGQRDTRYTTHRLAAMSKQRGNCLVVVDDTGVGGGVTDGLRELGVPVKPFVAAEKPEDPMFYNLRSEAWWNAAQIIKDNCELHDTDPELWSDLMAPHFDYRDTRILIESKSDIKERIGRSPDKGDAYVMGLWGLKYAWNPEKRRKRNNPIDRHPRDINPLAL